MNFRKHWLIWILILCVSFSQKAPKKNRFTWLFNQWEYRTPINFTLLELRVGGSMFGLGEHLDLDSTEANLALLQEPHAKVLLNGTLDILKINLTYPFIKQTMIDFQTGFGINVSVAPIGLDLPSDWIAPAKMTVRPEIKPIYADIHISETAMFQWENNSYFFGEIGYGRGVIYLYENLPKERDITTESPIWFFRTGMMFYKSIGENRFRRGLGMEYRYHLANFPDLRDPEEIVPINGFNLTNHGLFLTLNLTFGGEKTVGDFANESYLRGEYIKAEKQFHEFTKSYPKHNKIHRATAMEKKAQKMVPHQYMARAEKAFHDKDLEIALNNYNLVRDRTSDLQLIKKIDTRRQQMGLAFYEIGMSALGQNRIKKSEHNLNISIKSGGQVAEHSRLGLAEVYFIYGERDFRSDDVNRAFEWFEKAIEFNPKIDERVQEYRDQVAIEFLKDAYRAVQLDEYVFARQSLLDVTKTESSASDLSEKGANILDDIIQDKTQERVVENVKQHTQHKSVKNNVQFGMSAHDVLKIMGKPHTRYSSKTAGEETILWLYPDPFSVSKSIYVYFQSGKVVKIESGL